MRFHSKESGVKGGLRVWTLAIIGGLLVLLMAAAGCDDPNPESTLAPGSERVPPPPGNCWNGALSGDPVFCYFLEEAQRAGEIEVAAVYKTPGGGRLYIYLRQTETVSDEVGAFFKEKAHEYLESAAGYDAYRVYECDGKTGEERTQCLISLLGPPWPRWIGFNTQIGHNPLPQSRVYERIFLYPGGVEGRRTDWGWASWRQVWPSTGARSPDGAGSSTTFDVSDVDLTNIPEPGCEEDFFSGHPMYISCHAWKRGPTELGIAGLQYIDEKVDAHLILQIDPNFDVSTLRKQAHFQMTAPIPEDSSQLGALVNELLGNDGDHPWDVHAVQVSYDFGQLWRWKVILDRFAFSAGNTIGITGGAVGMNNRAFDGPFGGEVWLNPGDPAGEDLADARNILIVWALDPERTATALPNLLPQLGIPADAVGLIGYDSATPLVPHPLPSDLTDLKDFPQLAPTPSDATTLKPNLTPSPTNSPTQMPTTAPAPESTSTPTARVVPTTLTPASTATAERTATSKPPASERLTTISSGSSHTCALRSNGTPVCWGSIHVPPSLYSQGEQFTSITAGGSHACALRGEGTPVCWGSIRVPPSLHSEGERFTSISSGSSHACALRSDGTPVCWGGGHIHQSAIPKGDQFAAIRMGVKQS